jgi:tetratricopeptide (TPR) repeat protein
MRTTSLAWSAGLAALLFTATASAQDPAAPAGEKVADWQIVKRDDSGQTGISPYGEELFKGRNAFRNKDYDGAIKAFEAAAAKEPDNQQAYVLLAQARMAKGDAEGAVKTVDDGRTKKGTADVQSRLLFINGDFKEQKAAPRHDSEGKDLEAVLAEGWDRIKEAWSAYTVFLQANSGTTGYPATADDRKKQIDRRVKLDKDYGEVKKRIAANAKKRDKK